jgi:nucleoside-diphosphate-sugar epimerase
MKISIIGLGWFGGALAQELKTQHEIFGTTRSAEKVLTLKQQKISAEILTNANQPSDELLSADVIVLNIPPFLGQLDWLKSWSWQPHTHLIFISSTSVYGQNSGTLDETTSPIPETENGKILLEEETWAQSFANYTIIRFGGLIGTDRHPGKTLSGRKNITGGNLPVNLIHLKDCLEFTKLVIERKITGEIFNLVYPTHPTRKDYYQDYCQKHNLPLPEFNDAPESGKIISADKAGQLYQFKAPLN